MGQHRGTSSSMGGHSSQIPSASSLANEVRRLEQGLADLKRSDASEVSLIHCATATEQATLVDRLSRHARTIGCVTATLSLRQKSLDALDGVVRDLIEHLVPPTRSGTSNKRGLLMLLDAFVKRHGKRSGEEFQSRAEHLRATGDLTSLVRAYLDAHGSASRELIAFNAWLNGTEIPRRGEGPFVRSALSGKTARKALCELTRIVRALGFSGCAFFLTEGQALAHRTARQREKAYTVLRELIDNFDSGRGTLATRLVLTGENDLFEGEHSVRCLAPLLSRLAVPSDRQPAPPHRSWSLLGPDETSTRKPAAPAQAKARPLRALIRISQGLPPTEAVASLSVGHERIDDVIQRLFHHVEMSGSVFTVLSGDYGTGKTHLLMHLTERALDQGHPVFRLDLERLNFDLGNPQRHLIRLLEQSVIPLRQRPSALDRAALWTRSSSRLVELMRHLREIEGQDTEASAAAARALRRASHAAEPGQAVEAFLGAQGLDAKPGSQPYRQDAYERLLLWLELLQRMDRCRGPVVLIDEAENLYTAGVARTTRRTALRSLSFYCGGALPSACVIIAITPKVLKQLRTDARDLLQEVSAQRTVLPWEDATMLSRRLSRLKPEPVPAFTSADRRHLVEKAVETHRAVRGMTPPLPQAFLKDVISQDAPPRILLRRVMDELERLWWHSE